MIRSGEKEAIRNKLSQVLSRSFGLGGSSFALKVSEVQTILQYTNPE
jgi:hypothetical protein